jgi:hypothetical protein
VIWSSTLTNLLDVESYLKKNSIYNRETHILKWLQKIKNKITDKI